MTPTKSNSRVFWICAIVTTLNALVSAGFSIARLLGPERSEVALYAASRSVALLAVVLGLLWLRSRTGIAVLAFTMGLVQAFDTVIGILAHQAGKTLGPLVFAVATFASVVPLLREIRGRASWAGQPERWTGAEE